MEISSAINRLRCAAKLTQAQFAEIFGVSQQNVGKWESGAATPDIDKLVLISKYFDVSLDALILGNDNRAVEEMKKTAVVKPQYQNMHDWDFYPSNLMTEYQQSVEEGLDIEKYKELFSAVSRLPKSETKKRLGDILYDVVMSAPQREDYKYTEPSELHEIRALRKKSQADYEYDADKLYDKLYGAWMGRICGCMLGKSIECIRTNELIPFLKETNNYPMHRYIYRSDLTDEINAKYKFGFAGRVYADEIDGMPALYMELRSYAITYGYLPDKGMRAAYIIDMVKRVGTTRGYTMNMLKSSTFNDDVKSLLNSNMACVITADGSDIYGNHAMGLYGYVEYEYTSGWWIFSKTETKYFYVADDGHSYKQNDPKYTYNFMGVNTPACYFDPNTSDSPTISFYYLD